MADYLFIDIDGYTTVPGNCNFPIKGKRGFVARELGYLHINLKGVDTGSIYFYDPEDVKLDTKKTTIRATNQLHYLPTNPTLEELNRSLANEHSNSCIRLSPSQYYLSTQLQDTMAALYDRYLQDCGELIVVHKGGPEGRWSKHLNKCCKFINLEEVKCPRVDDIVKAYPNLEMKVCPCHYEKLSVPTEAEIKLLSKDKQRRAMKAIGSTIHCPRCEVYAFAMWTTIDPNGMKIYDLDYNFKQ